MADDPFFPQPRAKGSYREPAQRELVVTETGTEPEEKGEGKAKVEAKAEIMRPLHPEEVPPSVKKEPPSDATIDLRPECKVASFEGGVMLWDGGVFGTLR